MAEEATTANGTTSRKKGKKRMAAKKKAAPKRAAKARAATKGRSQGEHGSKTQFIADHAHLKPKQVSEEAKKKNLDISPGYVSSVRSKAKANGASGTKAKTGRAKSSGAGAEADFRRAARGITLDRAQEILDEIRAAYGG